MIEAMVEAGFDDVLVANEVVDPGKIARLAALARRARTAVAVDDPEPVAALSREAVAAGVTIDVLIDVDILLHRCGVPSAAVALELARQIERLPGLRLRGVMGYEGRIRLRDENRTDKIVRAYAMLREALADPTITELQCGVYALMEPELLIMDLPFRCAASIRGTVISRHPGRVVLNAGRRVVGMEYGPPVPVGVAAESIWMSDEHATIAMPDPLPALGSQVDMTPGQIRTTFNLHDHVWLSRGGTLVDRWPITARGSSQ